MTWEEFMKKGYYIVPVPKDYRAKPALRWYYDGRERDTADWGPRIKDQPINERTGLATPSGKIEFEARSLLRFDPHDEERPPVPHFIPSWEGHLTKELLA